MRLTSPVTEIKGVGAAQAAKFAQIGIRTVADLIDYWPRRYQDYSKITDIAHLRPGPVTIEAEVEQVTGRYVRRGMHISEGTARDPTGAVKLVWFNQPYRAAGINRDATYYISGNYELTRQRFNIMNPSLELVSDFSVNTARVIPVYKETKGLTSRQIRLALSRVLVVFKDLPDNLPARIVTDQKLMGHAQAIQAIHFPDNAEQLEFAQRRLGFEEVFALSLASLLNKQEFQHETALSIPFNQKLAQEFVGHLPFELTDAQKKVIWQLYLDMQKTQPMNRLVEGDVGSGKTVVAAMVAIMAIEQGWQVALMAPTELLARQHADTIFRLMQPLGLENTVALLVGSLKPAQKTATQAAIAKGQARFIIGTHALIQDKVDMHKLALVVIDEQHRFGVKQRAALQVKAGHMPHVLSLTATPIPRSLALTLYGELDISILDAKPKGRLPIITQVVSPNSRAQLNEQIDEQLEQGRQMFVVCPLISDSAVMDLTSAEKTYEQLSRHDFKHRRVGLLHGKMPAQEKNDIMQAFVRHELDILVATTVIEVGVDVPNANMMLIESAERFGLAQAHQLRGRVGRGEHQSYCYLMQSDSKPPNRRLRALETSNDGFKLAELDLELRGPGAIYGAMQHGELDLRIAKLSDTKLIAAARNAAQKLLDSGEDLLHYEQLMQQVNRLRAVTNLN